MTASVTVRHNFETAHRLPHIGGKCYNLHGHSWWVAVTVTAPQVADDGTVIEFGDFKRALREWIDHHLDHGAMLGAADPLAPILREHGSKVLVFGEGVAAGLEWPTVENVARLLADVAAIALADLEPDVDATVTRVTVSETHVNTAEWSHE